jgi:hypothetical protein
LEPGMKGIGCSVLTRATSSAATAMQDKHCCSRDKADMTERLLLEAV